MAYTNSTRVGTSSLSHRLSASLAALRGTITRRRLYSRTVQELSGLNDRELADLGIHRSSITEIATEAAYGK